MWSGFGFVIHDLPNLDAAQLARISQATNTTIDYPYKKLIPGVDFPQMNTSINFLVEGCPRRETSRTNLQLHYMHRNLEETIVILNKGPCPHPCCNQCNIFIPQDAMLARYLSTKV